MERTSSLLLSVEEAFSAEYYEKAQALVDEARKTVSEGSEQAARLYYWQGKIEMKRAEWTKAMSSFLKAEAISPDSPARECRLMLLDIMEFYNKDMFNQ